MNSKSSGLTLFLQHSLK